MSASRDDRNSARIPPSTATTSRPSRRSVLAGGAFVLAGGLLPGRLGSAAATPLPKATRALDLSSGFMDFRLLGPDKPASRISVYDGTPFKTIRARRGEVLDITYRNGIDEGTTVHWHGIRIQNAFDGIPTLTQPLVQPGGTFRYLVPLDDPGTFFFHPHCDETGQTGKGLAGVLLVEDERDPAFDAEHVLCLKDWRLADDGSFLAMSEPAGASKAGTYGATRTVNGQPVVELEAPAHGDVRLRILNLDSTRVMDIGVDHGDAALIAVDGHALPPILLDNLPDGVWRMGPAQRIDLHIRMPAAGGTVRLADYRQSSLYTFATLTATSATTPAATPAAHAPRPFRPFALPRPQVPRADLKRATRLSFLLQQATDAAVKETALPPDDPLAKALIDSLCVGSTTYWAIGQQSWPTGTRRNLPPPLAEMTTGRSYRVSINNGSRYPHPVHLHGHVFEVINSSTGRLPHHFADTVLVQPDEIVEIAFVAAPGDWVFHCHILEHMEAGMMGYFRVT
ncbi:multicopper oxidase family protein [Ancylobacter sp. 6x-1]|uniref:Multicopper oxidase family protein n=1 Tax=Ancylobacter crimeensis TaxID=2579147 RepID=A0ABT0D6E9_9HYPH|nr:multicopper oxidase family protein [Ancylobacter crimeensis]MCK0195520.1 multicopper oxidase family protein [Ancylobacter crimeensis]